ncbi:MAG: hypothetical protein ACOCQM_09245 [Natronomonas sp.]
MTPRKRSALLWGVVGALAFLVAHQGYLLVDGAFVGVGPLASVTVAVFAASVLTAYYAEGRFGTTFRVRSEGDGE